MKKFQNFQTEQLLNAIYENFGNLQASVESLGFERSKSNARSLILELRERNIFIDSYKIKQDLIRKQYYDNPKRCKFCNEIIPFEQKENDFCNHSCASKYNNCKQKEERFCLNCGKLLNIHQKLFCCHNCQHEYYQNLWIVDWKSGKESGLSGKYNISNRIKKYFLEKYDYKCQNCGWGMINQYTNTVPLELHHIDGNYLNNNEGNLQLLCPNCHSLTETYKSHNKVGRKERIKYK